MAPKVQHEYAATHQRARSRVQRPWRLRRSCNWSLCGSRRLGDSDGPQGPLADTVWRVPVPSQHGGGRLTATSGVLHTSTCLLKPSLARHHAAEYAQHATHTARTPCQHLRSHGRFRSLPDAVCPTRTWLPHSTKRPAVVCSIPIHVLPSRLLHATMLQSMRTTLPCAALSSHTLLHQCHTLTHARAK